MRSALRRAAAVFIVSLAAFAAQSQSSRSVDFLGVISSDTDANMIQMTETLYLTQLGEVPGISVIDRRQSGFVEAYKAQGTPDFSKAASPLAFYALIGKKDSSGGKWDCTICIADIHANDINSYTQTYDSYYKILMESKTSLRSIFESLLNKQSPKAADGINDSNIPDDRSPALSTDSIAGTWSGEDYIDKIVILRGGRGFIIYKNGATMNISVSVAGKEVTVTQAGKSNASFFPELPREAALLAATDAPPLTWKLTVQNNATLSGIKTTLIESDDGIALGDVRVEWKRK
ncbi:hypothetical protein [Treponema sp. Marseille-Q4130]|uniref:TP0183 family DNA metabolism protein n=1 Tax=Treponema sp. Marseille-Q4130 TaxID=2766702 RepID=UPI0016526D13|nr:hypothetical protein [Treponema sp. Marseille-Q4130]MBC6720258.1 hypothetical protein [Treponema sp. Marseille-Q4130]